MDNLAHSLVGLAAAKAGLEKLSPGATAVCILAANAPDIDFISLLSRDRWTVLHHHRGVSHSILGVVVLGLLLPAIFCAIEFVICKIRQRATRFRYRGLALASLIAVATHPLLDWTNSYGVRPLLPWNGRWFYGDLVFVVDPMLWLIVGGTAFLLTAKTQRQKTWWGILASLLTILIFYSAMTSRAVEHPVIVCVVWVGSVSLLIALYKAHLDRKLGTRVALTGFALLLAYWCALGVLHSLAMHSASLEMAKITRAGDDTVLRMVATPMVVNPLRWRCVAETSHRVYRFDVYVGQTGVRDVVSFEKADSSNPLIAEASVDRRARIFLEFARFPVERVVGADCATQTLVQFADLRYTEPGQTRGSFSLEVPVECPKSGGVTNDGR